MPAALRDLEFFSALLALTGLLLRDRKREPREGEALVAGEKRGFARGLEADRPVTATYAGKSLPLPAHQPVSVP